MLSISSAKYLAFLRLYKNKKKIFALVSEVRCEAPHPIYGAMSRRGLNAMLAYDSHRPDGRPHS